MVSNIQIEERKKSWEEYISSGMVARENKDSSCWMLGDLANAITTDYGENTIGKYAYAIGVEKKTLMNYRTTTAKFDVDTRKKYRKLSFSHFAVIASTEKPEAWLEKADDEEWNVEMLKRELRNARQGDEGPKLDDDPPEATRCKTCGLWRLKNLSAFEICKGHYNITKKGKMVYY
jgi:predicted ATPase